MHAFCFYWAHLLSVYVCSLSLRYSLLHSSHDAKRSSKTQHFFTLYQVWELLSCSPPVLQVPRPTCAFMEITNQNLETIVLLVRLEFKRSFTNYPLCCYATCSRPFCDDKTRYPMSVPHWYVGLYGICSFVSSRGVDRAVIAANSLRGRSVHASDNQLNIWVRQYI